MSTPIAFLRIVRGSPTAEEIAALVAAVSLLAEPEAERHPIRRLATWRPWVSPSRLPRRGASRL
jgi:hypothetical protein